VTTPVSVARRLLMLPLLCAAVVETACGDRKPDPATIRPADETPMASHPNVLFEVFGEREDPRMIPLAAIENGKLRRLTLSGPHWKAFDRAYDRSGSIYTLYQDGRVAGTATVKQGMWEKASAPLYSLPNCQLLLPLSAVTLDSHVKAGITVEFLATGTALPSAVNPRPSLVTQDDAVKKAREIGLRVGTDAGIPRARLDSLDYHGLAVNTGATAEPTLIASFIDPSADDGSRAGKSAYVFAIADKIGGEYTTSFVKTVDGSAAHAEYRRYVDHLDIDGDGVDEIFLEGWRTGGDSYPIIVKYVGGRWTEIFRGTPDWCLDQRIETSNPFVHPGD